MDSMTDEELPIYERMTVRFVTISHRKGWGGGSDDSDQNVEPNAFEDEPDLVELSRVAAGNEYRMSKVYFSRNADRTSS